MRIIAGQFRSRVLLPPQGTDTTRPITDRVKQSVFDILSPLIEGSIVYDCFAGTGSMGLECLSRGAKHAHFFEADRSALDRLRKNIATLAVASSSTIVSLDLFRHFAAAPAPREPAMLIFLDPPYRFLKERPADLQSLAKNFARHLHPQGLVIFRHDARDQLALPALALADTRTYGQMTVEFLGPPADPN